jgi:hypothetical protein
MNNRQTRDWVKQHHDKKVRSTAKRQQEAALTKHHNELLARFYGNPIFDSSVANKVNKQLEAQMCGEYQ